MLPFCDSDSANWPKRRHSRTIPIGGKQSRTEVVARVVGKKLLDQVPIVWAFKAKLRLRFGTPCVGPEISTARTEVFLLVMAICTRAWGDAYDEPALNGDREPIRRQSDVNARREGFIATTFEVVLGTSRCSASATLLANRSRR